MDSFQVPPTPEPVQPAPLPARAPSFRSLAPQDNPPWGWVDIVIFIVVTVGLYFGITMILAIGYIASGHGAAELKGLTRPAMIISLYTTVLASIGQMLFLFFRTRTFGEKHFWRGLGWISFESLGMRTELASTLCVLGGIALGLLVGRIDSAIGHKAGSSMEQFMHDRHTALFLGILGIALAPLVEETIFRGFIYPIAQRTLGIISGVILTGVLFGLLHGFQLWPNWPQILLLVFVGIVFTYVRAKTKTTLASFIMHLSYNGFIFVSFFVATNGLKDLPILH
jgi:membrane protease YdiL (CAAX protease family)